MEMDTSETYVNFMTPNQLSLSKSLQNEQCETVNTSQEQSLHIIVEPQIDGQTNYIHLINPPTGQIISSYIADHGSHIEIQPGVFFRVPFPHEHGYPYGGNNYPMSNQHSYHQAFQNNISSHNRQSFPSIIIPSQQYNPFCSVHGSPRSSQTQPVVQDIDKRREKLQKKISDKQTNINDCTCVKHTYHKKLIDKNCVTDPVVNDISIDDISLHVSLEGEAISPYAIILKWCLKSNALLLCEFDLQISMKGNAFKSIYNGPEKCFTAHELNPGTLYTFRLCAVLNNTQGSYCDPVACTTFCSVPDKPASLRITQKSKNSLTLKWTAPYDGGSPITFYRLQWRKDLNEEFRDLYVGPQKQYKLNHKLPPLTSCQFQLQAANELGEGEFNAILECLTCGGPPSIPNQPELTECHTNMLGLSWNEPDDNGSPILEYKLEMNNPTDGYGFMVQYCGELKQFMCNNLLRNTPYTFRLMATNDYGSSKYSVPVTYSTLAEAPGKMAKPMLNGKIKPFSIPIKWGLPKDTGGEQIIGYVLEMDDGLGQSFTKVYHGPDNEFLINNLQPGRTYQVKVASESKVGIGTFSPVANFTTLAVCPKNVNPPRFSLAPEMNVLHLEWDPPLDIGGSVITSYSVKTLQKDGKSDIVYNGVKQRCSVGDLEPGKEYFFSVQATNSAGSSQWSSVVGFKTAPGPPDAIHPPIISFKSPTHIFFDWTEPNLHGAPIIMYSLEKLENELFQKVFHGTTSFCDLKQGLQPSNTYYFRLQAHSAAGNSPYSSIFTAKTPPAPPGPVQDIKILEQTSNSCFLEWQHPQDNGSRVTEYILEATGTTSMLYTIPRPIFIEDNMLEENVLDNLPVVEKTTKLKNETLDSSDDEYSSSDEEEVLHHSISSSESSVILRQNENIMEYRLTGLEPDTLYKLRIQAVSEVGIGAFSQYVQFYTKELPPLAPTLSASSISYHSIKLKWGHKSLSKKSVSILNHTLQMQNKSGSFSTVYSGMDTSFTLSKLKELTPYCFRIQSSNEAGEGQFSMPKVFYTKAQPPSHVKELKCQHVDTTSVKLVWTPVESIRPDDIIKYTLQMQNVELGKDFSQVYNGIETEFTLRDLESDKIYQFRIYVTRTLSAADRNILANVPEDIKGIHSPIMRVHTLCQATIKECEHDSEIEEPTQTNGLTDTHIALILLGSFLAICVVTIILTYVATNQW